jgi:hypothetical protein
MHGPQHTKSLEQHLRSFGIRHFNSDHYWAWGGKALGPKRAAQLNLLREPLTVGLATSEQFQSFYDYMAQ